MIAYWKKVAICLPVAGLIGLAWIFVGCKAVSDIFPAITNADAPPGPHVFPVTVSARVDPKNWGFTEIYFTHASTAEAVGTPQATRIPGSWIECVPAGGTAQDCSYTILQHHMSAGDRYYQWHIDYGQSDEDVATLARPTPPNHLFLTSAPDDGETNEGGNGGGNGEDNGIGDEPPVQGCPLALLDPEAGASCAGTYAGQSAIVTFRWHCEDGVLGTALAGDYQVMIERAGDEYCEQAADEGHVNPDAHNAALEMPDCVVRYANTNETAVTLQPGVTYRWRVRRITNLSPSSPQFGPWLNWQQFATATQNC